MPIRVNSWIKKSSLHTSHVNPVFQQAYLQGEQISNKDKECVHEFARIFTNEELNMYSAHRKAHKFISFG